MTVMRVDEVMLTMPFCLGRAGACMRYAGGTLVTARGFFTRARFFPSFLHWAASRIHSLSFSLFICLYQILFSLSVLLVKLGRVGASVSEMA